MKRVSRSLSILIAMLMLSQMAVWAGGGVETANVIGTELTTIAADQCIDTTVPGERTINVDNSVTVMAGKTVSYKVKATRAGYHKLVVTYKAAAAVTTTVTVTGATKLGKQYIPANNFTANDLVPAHSSTSYVSNRVGSYNLTGEDQTLTLTFDKEATVKDIKLKPVQNIPIGSEPTTINLPLSSYYCAFVPTESIYLAEGYISQTQPEGRMMTSGSYHYATFSVDVKTAGLYTLGIDPMVGKNLTLNAGVCVVNALTYNRAQDWHTYSGTIPADATQDGTLTASFENIYLTEGHHFIEFRFNTKKADNTTGENKWIYGVSFNYTGAMPTLQSVTAGGASLSEGGVVATSEKTFALTFSDAVTASSATTDSVYFKKGETKITPKTVSAEGAIVTVTADTADFDGCSDYKLCVQGVVSRGLTINDEFAFITRGSAMLSHTALTEILARHFDSASEGVTVSGDSVTIPAGGTVSYRVNVPSEDVYRIWAYRATPKVATLAISGVDEIDNNVTLSAAEGIKSKAGWKTSHNDGAMCIMGRYTIAPNEDGTVITFTATAETNLTKIAFKNVSEINVPATGTTIVDLADYMYNNISSNGYDSVYVWKAPEMSSVVGSILAFGTSQWATHELYIEEPGAYRITAYMSGNASGLTNTVTLQTGSTLAEAANAGKSTLSITKALNDTSSFEFVFNRSITEAGKYYVTTSNISSLTLKSCFNGFKIERVGDALDVSSVKAGETVINSGDEVSTDVGTFELTFTKNVGEVDTTKIFLKKGIDVITPTAVTKTAENVVSVTVPALDNFADYKLCIEGVSDAEGISVMSGFEYIFKTKGAHAISESAETVIIPAKCVEEISVENGLSAVDTQKVKVGAGKAISYNVKVTKAGYYKVMVNATGSGTIALSGATEITQETTYAEAARKTISGTYANMGRYYLNAGETVLTFTPANEITLNQITLKYVGGLDISASNDAVKKISITDYLYANTSGNNTEENFTGIDGSWFEVGMKGAILSLSSAQYVSYSLDVEKAGIYTISVYAQDVKNAKGTVGLRVGKTITEAAAAERTVKTYLNESTETAMPCVYTFENVELDEGTNLVCFDFTGSSNDGTSEVYLWYTGISVQRTGDLAAFAASEVIKAVNGKELKLTFTKEWPMTVYAAMYSGNGLLQVLKGAAQAEMTFTFAKDISGNNVRVFFWKDDLSPIDVPLPIAP